MLLYADLHIHSCLSPCGDELMTPNNIVNMAMLKGLDIISVTDHNTCANLPAVFSAAHRAGITVIPGMEMETAEEVHTLAYFPSLEAAMKFSDAAYSFLPPIENNPRFFGEQLVLDENDEPVRTEPRLLLSPLSLTLEEGFELVRQFGGVAVPAHIDRPSHGIIPILGFINPHLGVCCVEVSPLGMANGFSGYDPRLRVLSSSDAHDLGAILELQQELDLPECSTEAFLSYISGK